MPSPGRPYRPVLAAPSRLSYLQTGWSNCALTASFEGIDPPRVLTLMPARIPETPATQPTSIDFQESARPAQTPIPPIPTSNTSPDPQVSAKEGASAQSSPRPMSAASIETAALLSPISQQAPPNANPGPPNLVSGDNKHQPSYSADDLNIPSDPVSAAFNPSNVTPSQMSAIEQALQPSAGSEPLPGHDVSSENNSGNPPNGRLAGAASYFTQLSIPSDLVKPSEGAEAAEAKETDSPAFAFLNGGSPGGKSNPNTLTGGPQSTLSALNSLNAASGYSKDSSYGPEGPDQGHIQDAVSQSAFANSASLGGQGQPSPNVNPQGEIDSTSMPRSSNIADVETATGVRLVPPARGNDSGGDRSNGINNPPASNLKADTADSLKSVILNAFDSKSSPITLAANPSLTWEKHTTEDIRPSGDAELCDNSTNPIRANNSSISSISSSAVTSLATTTTAASTTVSGNPLVPTSKPVSGASSVLKKEKSSACNWQSCWLSWLALAIIEVLLVSSGRILTY